MRPYYICAIAATLLVGTACVDFDPPGPDPSFLVGGWTDPDGNLIRFRQIRTRLPDVIGAEYLEGRIEWISASKRSVGIWNYGNFSPTIVLNIVLPGKPPAYWAIEEAGPDRATLWISEDPAFINTDWRATIPPVDLHRIDSDTNPEPKLTREEAQLPDEAILLN